MAASIVETTVRAAANLAGSTTVKTDAAKSYGMRQVVFFLTAADADTLTDADIEVSNKIDAADADWDLASAWGYAVVGISSVEGERLDHGPRCLMVFLAGSYISHSFVRLTLTSDTNQIDNLAVTASAFKEGPAETL